MTKSNNKSKSKSAGNSSSSSSSYGNVKINNYGGGGGGISSTRRSISSRPRRINTNNWDGWKPIIQSCGGGTGASLIGCAAGPPIKIVSNLFTTKKIPAGGGGAAAATAASANNSTKTAAAYNMKDATPSSSLSSSIQAAITAVTASTNGIASSVSNNKRHWTGGVKNVIQHIKNNSDKWECKLAKIAAKVSSSSSSSFQHQHQQQQNDDYQFGPAAAAAATAVGTIDFNSFEAFHYEYLQNDVAYGQLYYGKQTTQDILIDAGLMNSPTTSPSSSSSSFVPKGASIKSIDRNLIIFLSNDIPTLSGTHRDGTHSILYVLSGTKSVYLAPPDTNEKMNLPYENNGSITNSLNYNPFQHQEEFVTIMGEDKPNSNSNSNSSSCWKRVDLIPGESLYIPKGWWHNVYSPSNTVAFSIDISIDTVHSYRDAASEINLCNISGMAYNCNTKMSNIRDSIIAIEEEDIDNNDDDDDDDEDYYDEGKKRKALSPKNAGNDPRPSSSPPPVKKKKKKKRRRKHLKSKVEGLEYETSFHGICPGIFPIIDNATTSRTAPLPPPPLRLDQEIFPLSVTATATTTATATATATAPSTTNDSNTGGPTTTEQQLQHPAGEQQQQQQQEPPLSPTPPPGALEEEEELQSLLSSTLPKYSPQSQSVTAAAAITPPEEVTQSPDDTKTVTAGEEEEEESFFFNITKTIIAFDNSKSKSKSDRGGRR